MLNVSGLTSQYGTHVIFSDLSFQLQENTLAVLVGRNGAGKSTLLRALAGWTLPEAGDVVINDVSLREDEIAFREQILLVPDTPDFYDELTAWEHMQFVGQLHSIPDWHNRSIDLLEELDLMDHWKSFPFTFSRGMRYKLALAMAFLVQPPLLLLDEPFGPLDSIASDYLWETLQAYQQDGNSVLFSSHVLQKAHQPDQFLVLKQGEMKVVAADEVERIGVLLDEG